MPVPKFGQPNVGSGAPLAPLPPTAAYIVGDRCRSLANATLRVSEDIRGDSIVILPINVGVEVLELGIGNI